MSEEGHWIERDSPDDIPEPAKPKKVRREKHALVIQPDETPQSPDAERGIVSSMLAKPMEIIPDFREKCSLDWFYNDPLRELVGEMFSCLDSKGALDIVILSQWLIDRGMMDKIGGPFTLAELQSFVPTPEHYPYYCGILSDKAKLRAVLSGSGKIREACHSPSNDMVEVGNVVASEAGSMIRLFEPSATKEQTLGERVMEWMEEYKLKTDGKRTSAMPTRWAEFNRRMGGLDGGYTIVSGEYSAGKSVLLRNILVDACITKGRPGLLINYETTIKQTISGMVCDIGNVRSDVVFRPDFNKPTLVEEKAIARALQIIAGSKLKIVHEPYLSAEGIGVKANAMKNKFGDVVVGVDYLQKIPRPKHIEKNANQERELACVSDILQKVAKELGCPVVVACQLNKEGTARGSASIMMDGDSHYRIEGPKGVWVEKFKEGERHFHLPMFLNGQFLRFEQAESDFP